MKKAFKVAFLYIGTAIGAGFSSGKELALFFGAASPLNVAISSIFMSLLCLLFLCAGKLGLTPKGRIVRIGVFLSAGISLCSMLAGSEFVLSSLIGVPLMGLIMAIAGGIIVVLGIERIKLANSVLVPLIVLSIAVIFFKLDPQPHALPFSLSRPILYSGLDVLLGGVIISEEGEKLSFKEIFLSCVFICVCLFCMLFMLQTVVLADGLASSMPVLSVAERFGLKPLCGILIATAIFTTLVSSLKIVSDSVTRSLLNSKRLSSLGEERNRAFIVFMCLLLAYPISFVGFDAIVDNLYPFMSVCGVALTAIAAIKLAAFLIGRAISRIKRSRAGESDKEVKRRGKAPSRIWRGNVNENDENVKRRGKATTSIERGRTDGNALSPFKDENKHKKIAATSGNSNLKTDLSSQEQRLNRPPRGRDDVRIRTRRRNRHDHDDVRIRTRRIPRRSPRLSTAPQTESACCRRVPHPSL